MGDVGINFARALYVCVVANTLEKSVCYRKATKKTFSDKFRENLIYSFFGKKFEIDSYFLQDFMDMMFIEADVYRVKLKNNIIDVGNEWKALIKK